MFCHWCQGLPGNQQKWQIVTQKMQSSSLLSNGNLSFLHSRFFFLFHIQLSAAFSSFRPANVNGVFSMLTWRVINCSNPIIRTVFPSSAQHFYRRGLARRPVGSSCSDICFEAGVLMVGGGRGRRSCPGLGVYNYILISGGVTVQLAPRMCGINPASFMIAEYSLIYFLNLVYGDLDGCPASAATPRCCCCCGLSLRGQTEGHGCGCCRTCCSFPTGRIQNTCGLI